MVRWTTEALVTGRYRSVENRGLVSKFGKHVNAQHFGGGWRILVGEEIEDRTRYCSLSKDIG